MKKFLKKIKKGIYFLFFNIFKSISFVFDNSIGLIFTKKIRKYQEKNNNSALKFFKILFIMVLSVLLFRSVYNLILLKPVKYLLTFLGNILQGSYKKVINEYGLRFSEGIRETIFLSLTGTVMGLILAIPLSFLITLKISERDNLFIKVLKKIGFVFSKTYVTIFRGTPMIVQAMIIFYGIRSFIEFDPLEAGLITVTLNTTAYLTEVLRGGIESIHQGQFEGAYSLGLSKWKTMIYVIYPQAIKNSMAAIGNEFIINIKDTSVLNVISVVDIYKVASDAKARYLSFPPFLIAALIYLFLTFIMTRILKKVEKRFEVPVKELPSSN